MATTPAPTVHIPLDANGRLDVDLPCVGCEYNLRSMKPDGQCPECGHAVGPSLQTQYLDVRDYKWGRCVIFGCTLILISMLIGIPFWHQVRLVNLVAGFIDFRIFYRYWPNVYFSIIGEWAAVVVYVFGYWLATTIQPTAVADKRIFNVRRVVRCTLLVWLVYRLGVGYVYSIKIGIFLPTAQLVMTVWDKTFMGMSIIVMIIYAQQLAKRWGWYRLAEQTRIVTIGLGIAMGANILIYLHAALIRGPIRWIPYVSLNHPTVTIFFWIGVFGWVIFGLWLVILVFWYRRLFVRKLRWQRANTAGGLSK